MSNPSAQTRAAEAMDWRVGGVGGGLVLADHGGTEREKGGRVTVGRML